MERAADTGTPFGPSVVGPGSPGAPGSVSTPSPSGSVSTPGTPGSVNLPSFPQPLTAACAFDAPSDPDAVVMAVGVGRELRFVRADGEYEVAYEFPAVEVNDYQRSYVISVQARGGYVLTSAIVPEQPDEEDGYYAGQGNLTVLLDLEGNVLWEHSIDPEHTPYYGGWVQYSLGDDGSAAYQHTMSGDITRILWPDGSMDEYVDFALHYGGAVDGRLPVQKFERDLGIVSYGWLDLASREYASAFEGNSDTWQHHPAYLGNAWVRYEASAGRVDAIISWPHETVRGALPTAFDTVDSIRRWTIQGDYSLIGHLDSGDELFVLDHRTGTTTELDVRLPDGMRLMNPGYGYYHNGTSGLEQLALADDGSLMLALRNDDFGALYRSGDYGRTWSQLGATVAHVNTLNFIHKGTTWAIGAQPAGYYYEVEGWDADASAEVNGMATQLVRDFSDDVTVLEGLNHWALNLNETGECAARWENTGEEYVLNVLEVDDATDHTLFSVAPENAYGQFIVWIDD